MSGRDQLPEVVIEPGGCQPIPSRRFVVLLHDHPVVHWDFLLENGATLRTWRLPRDPCQHDVMEAEEIAPHRSLYLNYEGPVSGGRGTVRRIAAGRATVWETTTGLIALDTVFLETTPPEDTLGLPWKEIRLTRLAGTRWQFRLQRHDAHRNPEIPGAGRT